MEKNRCELCGIQWRPTQLHTKIDDRRGYVLIGPDCKRRLCMPKLPIQPQERDIRAS